MLNLNKIFLINIFIAILISVTVFILIDFMIIDDFDSIKDINILKDMIREKILILFLFVTIIYILLIKRVFFKIYEETLKVDKYLNDVHQKFFNKKLKLKYSLEFYSIGKQLSSIILKFDKLNRKKRKFNAKLKVINYQQEKLLGAISHELKNPMSSILGYSQILKDEFENENFPKIYTKFLNKIINNGKRIDELLDRLRLAVQLDNNKFELKYRVFHIDKSINSLVSNLDLVSNRKITLDIESYELYADKTLIELVLVNLIENAIKYSNGDVIVKLENNYLKVTDFGIGIDENELSNVTKRFYRTDRKSHQQSMGLGLAIVSYILKLHNLKLDITSRLGTGSTFAVNLFHIKNRKLPKEIMQMPMK